MGLVPYVAFRSPGRRRDWRPWRFIWAEQWRVGALPAGSTGLSGKGVPDKPRKELTNPQVRR